MVFEVGGVIDLAESTLRITEPYLTIAGQTAPAPGITLIRGGIDITTHDVIVRHIRVRPGDGGRARLSGSDYDAISTIAAHDVIVDHCSLTWATDENLSASGPRFTGNSPEEWRKGTSHRITFSNNIIAEGLADSVHVKGEHSKGSLIHDNVSDILIIGNLYAHDQERSPLFKGGVRGAIVNNLIYDPGQRAIHYNLIAEEWGNQPYQTGEMTIIGNVLRGGQSTPSDLPLVTIGGSGDVAIHEARQHRGGSLGPAVADARHVHDRTHQGSEAAGDAYPGRHAAAGARGAGPHREECRRVSTRRHRRAHRRRHHRRSRLHHRQPVGVGRLSEAMRPRTRPSIPRSGIWNDDPMTAHTR